MGLQAATGHARSQQWDFLMGEAPRTTFERARPMPPSAFVSVQSSNDSNDCLVRYTWSIGCGAASIAGGRAVRQGAGHCL